MKRVLRWAGLVVLVLVVALGVAWYSAFGQNSPIAPGTLVPGVETVKDGFVGIFVLDAGPGKVALVDAGNDKSGRALLDVLAQRGLTSESVLAVFLTHGHADHTAACNVLPHAAIYALESELPLLGGALKIAHPLKDGETTEVGDLRVEAFAVPGHTPGSAVYLARGVLFFGDSAGASKDGALMKAVRLFSTDPAQNVASLKALAARLQPRATEVKALAFAHTGPLFAYAPLAQFASRP